MDGTTILMLWALLLIYVFIIIEKAFAAGGFPAFVRRHLTPAYDTKLFFLQHGMWLTVLFSGILLATTLGQRWMVIPLGLGFALVFEGPVLMAASLKFKKYVPGLLTLALAWPVMYAAVRTALHSELIEPRTVAISALMGAGLSIWSLVNFLLLRLDHLHDGAPPPPSHPRAKTNSAPSDA